MDPRLRLGRLLRDARAVCGLSLDELSRRAGIPIGHLAALEEGRIAELPAGLYRRAEVRAFAEAVGLDPAHALALLSAALEERQPSTAPAPAPIRSNGSLARPGNASPSIHRGRGRAAAVVTPGARRVAQMAALVAAALTGLVWERLPAGEAARWLPRVDAGLAQWLGLEGPDAGEAGRPAGAASITLPLGTPLLASALLPPPHEGGGSSRWTRPADGVLEVHSTPRGARVTVNGVGWGETPLHVRYLPLGAQRVRVAKPGYRSVERIVRLSADEPAASVRLALQAQAPRAAAATKTGGETALVIQTTPPGARVTVNGIGWGTSPVTVRHLATGLQRVRVVKPEYRPEERVVNLAGGERHVTIALRPSR